MLLDVRRRSMTKSPAKPRPVPVGRYRYSKWRWRASVRALDAAGSLGMCLWRRFRPARLATRTWFERRRGSWAPGTAVWALGRSLRDGHYDLGIDVRGDILTVVVLALAGIPRRLGWAMGGGGFLLTDVALWVPGRHEVNSRLALLERLGLPVEGPARVVVHVTDQDRLAVGGRLRVAWPDEGRAPRTTGVVVRSRQ